MIGLAVLFGLLSMLGFALANTFSQPLSRNIGSAPLLLLREVTICIVLGVISFATFGSLHGNYTWLLYAFILGFVGYLPLLSFTHGVKTSRISIIAPIAGTSTLVTVLLAAGFLGSHISSLQWVAVSLVIVANILVSVNIKDLRQSSVMQLSSGIPFALIAALGWGLFFFFIVYPTRHIGPWWGAFGVELGVTAAAALHIAATKQKIVWRQAAKPAVIANGLFICIGTAAYTIGVRHYSIPIVATFASSPAIVSSFLGIYLFKEKLRNLEIVAATVMIIGVVVISIG